MSISYLVEKSIAFTKLFKSPENYDGGKGKANIASPFWDVELLFYLIFTLFSKECTFEVRPKVRKI